MESWKHHCYNAVLSGLNFLKRDANGKIIEAVINGNGTANVFKKK